MMAEADVTGSIQVGQISSPMPEPLSVAVSAGIDYAEDEARPDVVADVNMTDVSGDQSVCIYPAVAADLHTSPITFETDGDRYEDGGHEGNGEDADVDVDADPHTLEATVDDVAAWPAVHALATMAQAPSSEDSMASGLETTQETAILEPNFIDGAEYASDVVNQAPGVFVSTANDLSMIEDDGGDELQFHEQGQGGGEAQSHSPDSAASASQSMNTHLPPIGHSLAHQNLYIYHLHQIGVHAGDSSPHAPNTPMHYLGYSSMQGLNNAHSLEAEHQPQNTQSAQPVLPVQADGSGAAPFEQALNTALAAHNGLASQASSNYAAALSTEIGAQEGLQTIGTANVQYLGPDPSGYIIMSTDVVNTDADVEVGFGEDFEESSSDGSSPEYFEGDYGGDFEESLDEDSEIDTEEEEEADDDGSEIEAATNAISHVNLPASLTSPTVPETIQQPQPVAVVNPATPPPQALSVIPMYNNLSPANHSLGQFLVHWSAQATVYRRPDRRSIDRQLGKPITCIRSQEVCEDRHDLQGINWEAMGVTRKQAREFRSRSFHNYVSVKDSDQLAPRPGGKKSWNLESYFRFRRMHVKTSVHLAHFQLRNLLASTSRSCAFYATSRGAVRKINTLTGTESVAMRFSEHSNVQISTIAADQRVLIAGGFAGEYCISDLTSEYIGEYVGTKRAEGTVTKHTSGISNHIQIHSLRNASGPLAAFASNDLGLRILDLNTGKVISAMQFSFPVNCTAISPDRRLRVVVGDSLDAYIIAAEPERSTVRPNGLREPEVLKVLGGHKDYGFACAWAPDGYTLATGNQDRTIKIWDARKWSDSQGKSTPVATLYSEMAGVRSLHFSPAGSGKRALVAAEEADFVNIIDAQTFRTCQTLDVFGEIGGVSLTSAGRDLLVLCADKTRGGLLHFDRCDTETRLARGGVGSSSSRNKILEMRRPEFSEPDWPDQPGAAATRRLRHRTNGLRLRTAAALDLEPY